MGTEDRVKQLVSPIVDQYGLELYDIELASGILRVTVDRPGGVDLDAISAVSQPISRLLDEENPLDEARYLLEVSSPGIERQLRVPAHFMAAVGSQVRVRLHAAIGGVRRFDGTLLEANETTVEFEVDGHRHSFDYADIEAARTIFDWTAAFSAKRKPDKAKTGDEDRSPDLSIKDDEDEENLSPIFSNKKASAR